MIVRGGERRDSAYYSIVDDEWPEVQGNLGRRLDAIRERQDEGHGEGRRRRGTVAGAMKLLPGRKGSGSRGYWSTAAWRSRSTHRGGSNRFI
jgi:hypothetical protein